jgi:hypothetical protein
MSEIKHHPEESIKAHYGDELYQTIVLDCGDSFDVQTFIRDESREDGWELCNNTGAIDTFEEALHDYRLHLDLYYGVTPESIS